VKEIKIQGFTTDTTPDYKPAIAAFGVENVGKTRFLTTAPHEDGLLAVLALDKNSKGTIDRIKAETGDKRIIVNDKPYITAELAKKAALGEPKVVKEIYSSIYQRVLEDAMRLADNKDVESVGVDNASILFDFILFSHFGRRDQIESFQRGPANQDMIDLVLALGTKNLVLLHRSAEEWKDTGEVDSKGRKKQGPSGKFKPEGFNKIGGFVSAVLELTSKRKAMGGGQMEYEDKYRAVVHSCKGNTLLEGQDLKEYGVCGEAITWDNVVTVLGLGS
jgi:hypothetical protein